ncbi:EXS-domain-containing protein [Myriangium duriaei CBS 260.36]|uniref:EXS-domain-containing protein n=1 Tax=Myriangium duriaei CBS 260.36 TaxID=1168546 RepID=A0A9P4MP84_9PEZI|nr:EXS-domain-containing protein [Myriangium duriaei CBS 260.36]
MADEVPVVPDELDSFSLILPLPFRVAIILVLGVWAWGLNLHYLRAIKIDVPALIHYPGRSSATEPSHHLSTYRLASILTIPLAASLFLFWMITHGNQQAALNWQILPNLYLLGLVATFVIPVHFLSRSGRYRTLSILRRISIGGLAEPQNGKFGDILMADVLTSYAKVLGDLFIALCMFFTPGKSSTGRPDRSCGGPWLIPLIIAIPSMIRLRQCLIEYYRVRASNQKTGTIGSHGWGGQHLANALKYSSAFPVIALSALQRGFDPAKIGLSETSLFRLWLLAVFVNSFYSFWWDVTKDWDLTLFSVSATKDRNDPDHPFGLRKNRFFHVHEVYYAVIAIDLMLRCTWSLKLSPHLYHFNDLEGGIFMMELLEVFRRWVWIFFRVETEWVRNNRPPVPQEDVLLSDFGNKYEDE